MGLLASLGGASALKDDVRGRKAPSFGWAAVGQYIGLANTLGLNLGLSLMMPLKSYALYSTSLAAILFFANAADSGANILVAAGHRAAKTATVARTKGLGVVSAIAGLGIVDALRPAGSRVPIWFGGLVALSVPLYTYTDARILARLGWRPAAWLKILHSILNSGAVLTVAAAGGSWQLLLLCYGGSYLVVGALGWLLAGNALTELTTLSKDDLGVFALSLVISLPGNLVSNGLLMLLGVYGGVAPGILRIALLTVGGAMALSPISVLHVASLERSRDRKGEGGVARGILVVVAVSVVGMCFIQPAMEWVYPQGPMQLAARIAVPALLAVPLFVTAQWRLALAVKASARLVGGLDGLTALLATVAFLALRTDLVGALTTAMVLLGGVPMLWFDVKRIAILVDRKTRWWGGVLRLAPYACAGVALGLVVI